MKFQLAIICKVSLVLALLVGGNTSAAYAKTKTAILADRAATTLHTSTTQAAHERNTRLVRAVGIGEQPTTRRTLWMADIETGKLNNLDPTVDHGMLMLARAISWILLIMAIVRVPWLHRHPAAPSLIRDGGTHFFTKKPPAELANEIDWQLYTVQIVGLLTVITAIENLAYFG